MSTAWSPLWFVSLAVIAAGALDILFAITFWHVRAGVPPTRILQSVAAGLLGRGSFAGGAATAALGLALHFAIVAAMAFAYHATASHWPALEARPLVWGSVYGLILYGVMNFVVVPLSAAPSSPRDMLWVASSLFAHIALVGIPIAFGTHFALRAPITQ
jgi:hypothetical protein